jgi:hypothetical protein
MKKAEVQTRYYRGERRPCVNVKVHGSVTPKILAEVERESGEVGFAAWAGDLLERGKWPEWAFGAACENGWEDLQRDAEDIFGTRAKVRSEGRSGGWCVVDGISELESWDAVMVSKWARFARWARAAADGIPFDMAMLLAINDFAAERERLEHQRAQLAGAEAGAA